MKKLRNVLAAVAVILATPAAAEVELSFYMGAQTSPHSRMTGSFNNGGGTTVVDRLITWEGKSFEAPPYYGVKAMYWRDSGWGFGVEMTHAKAYASSADLTALGLDRLEFTDGHNILTANVSRRWDGRWWNGRLSPFVTGGLGVAIPHVDAQPTGLARTFGYQVTGPAARIGAGVSMELNARWDAYAEYQLTYSSNKFDLDSGGTLETDLLTNALNIGITYGF